MGNEVFGALKRFVLLGGTTLKTSCLWGVPFNPQGHWEFTGIRNCTSLIWGHKSWQMGISFHSQSLEKKKKDSGKASIKKIIIKPPERCPLSVPISRLPSEGAQDDKNMD